MPRKVRRRSSVAQRRERHLVVIGGSNQPIAGYYYLLREVVRERTFPAVHRLFGPPCTQHPADDHPPACMKFRTLLAKRTLTKTSTQSMPSGSDPSSPTPFGAEHGPRPHDPPRGPTRTLKCDDMQQSKSLTAEPPAHGALGPYALAFVVTAATLVVRELLGNLLDDRRMLILFVLPNHLQRVQGRHRSRPPLDGVRRRRSRVPDPSTERILLSETPRRHREPGAVDGGGHACKPAERTAAAPAAAGRSECRGARSIGPDDAPER